MTKMLWIPAVILSRVFLAACNVFDSHFQNAHFRNGFSQNFFGSIYYIVVLPVLWLVIRPDLPPAEAWPWLLIAGVMFRLFLVPYFEAMNHADSSAVSSLFMLGRVFTPVIAWLLIGEHLTPVEWVGFLIVVAGAFYLTHTPGKMRFNFQPMLLMVASGLMMALYAVTSKLSFAMMPWLDAYFYIVLIGNLMVWATPLVPVLRKDAVHAARQFPSIWAPVGASVLLALSGNFLFFFAIAMTKVSYAVVITQFQPFFVILISGLFRQLGWLKGTRESFERADITRKVAAFLVMAAGLVLTLWPQLRVG